MPVSRVRAIVALACLAGLSAGASCSGSRTAARAARPPRAEFLLSSPDSTFWVNTTDGAVHLRGVPLILARYDKRFFELYSAEQDQSYYDALLVGERLYRRDLITGDSTVLFADTAVSHVAAIYARTHPDEHPLGAGEEGVANPQTSATAQLDILDVFGPYLSYEYHVDIRLPGRDDWHATRRGVLDLRSGKETEPGDLFGAERGRQIAADARHQYETMRDSAVRTRDALFKRPQMQALRLGVISETPDRDARPGRAAVQRTLDALLPEGDPRPCQNCSPQYTHRLDDSKIRPSP